VRSPQEILALLPHRPPMRLVEDVVEVVPGKMARTRRLTRPDDWYFNGHFPGQPVVPAIVLIELVAQTGGLAAGADEVAPLSYRVAAVGRFKFPAPSAAGALLETTAQVTGAMGALLRVEGTVTADGVTVAAGEVTLALVAGAQA
jgi:3-hydroxyacyl-[acyl-carrier-protein] dehydratase